VGRSGHPSGSGSRVTAGDGGCHFRALWHYPTSTMGGLRFEPFEDSRRGNHGGQSDLWAVTNAPDRGPGFTD